MCVLTWVCSCEYIGTRASSRVCVCVNAFAYGTYMHAYAYGFVYVCVRMHVGVSAGVCTCISGLCACVRAVRSLEQYLSLEGAAQLEGSCLSGHPGRSPQIDSDPPQYPSGLRYCKTFLQREGEHRQRNALSPDPTVSRCVKHVNKMVTHYGSPLRESLR